MYSRTGRTLSQAIAGLRRRTMIQHQNLSSRHQAATALQIRCFSDRLIGYSPMAPPSSSVTGHQDIKAIPTEQEVTTAGGVWAPTSAKRDKLAELKVALEDGEETLDDAATESQKLDLYLADGLKLIAKLSDSTITGASSHAALQEMEDWWKEQSTKLTAPTDLHQVQWEEYLRDVSKQLDYLLGTLPSDRYLKDVRDFLDPSDIDAEQLVDSLMNNSNRTVNVESNLDHAVLRFRLLLTKAAADHLQTSWETLTTVSDQDVDRAAVRGESLDRQASTLPFDKLQAVLRAYLQGNCADRVDTMWELLDRDGDGLLDQEEINRVCQLAIAPVVAALGTLMQEALDAYPVRAPLPELGGNEQVPQPVGWRQRRREAREQKRLAKMFQLTLKNHFEDEVEMPHRLRCIYAWANKEHQDNKIDSVLVDETGWSGRKRYVELHPKISLPEFREVQREHFKHLDRVGAEYINSFREDLWVSQGKGRQNRELRRDCALFLTVVCLIDYIVITL